MILIAIIMILIYIIMILISSMHYFINTTYCAGFPYGEGKYTYPDGGYYKGEYRNLLHVNKYRESIMEGLNRIPQCDGLRHGFGMVMTMFM